MLMCTSLLLTRATCTTQLHLKHVTENAKHVFHEAFVAIESFASE